MHVHLTDHGFDVYTFPLGAAGATSFHDPLEGTEMRVLKLIRNAHRQTSSRLPLAKKHAYSGGQGWPGIFIGGEVGM